jgi:uncharacterized coiled-coil protein SlyX
MPAFFLLSASKIGKMTRRRIMTENIVFKVFENIIPLLLAVIIVIVTVYIVVTRIFNIPTQIGKGIARKFMGALDGIEQSKWDRLEKRVADLQEQNDELNAKYTTVTKSLAKIKKELVNLSEDFEKFDKQTTLKDIFSNPKAIKNIFTNPKKFSEQKKYIWDKVKELVISLDALIEQ